MSKELPLTLSPSDAASPVVAGFGAVADAAPRPSAGVGSALMEEASNAAKLRAATVRRQKPVTLSLPTVRLGGVALHAVSEQTAIETILSELECGRGGTVVTPNLDHLKRCGNDVTFRALVEESDLVVADGMPLVWASKFQGTPLPERVAGSNLIGTLSEAAAAAGRRIFLLGGDPGQAEGAAEVLRERYPDLDIGGTYCPPYGFEYDTKEMAKMVEVLTQSKPDIIFVALGSPKQEKLINQIKRTLPDAWWLGVGISFSFLTGHVRRAPQWMQATGLEWVHRLGQEPKRLFKRYVVHGIPFFTRLMGSALWYRARNAVGMAPRAVAKQIASDRVFTTGVIGEPARIDVEAVSSTVNRSLDPQTQLDSDANARAVDEALELAACDQPESAVVASLEVGTDAQAV
ncbi:MAG: WecB/TagA/CpsF family glycosyltransferase, partial [Planctomycetota bacterium]